MAVTNYSRVSRGIWDSTTFRPLPPDAKLVYLYLKTCRYQNVLGAFVCRPDHVAVDLPGYSTDRVSKQYQALEAATLWPGGPGLIVYCDVSGLVFLVNQVAHDQVCGPKQIQGAEAVVRNLPYSSRVMGAIAEWLPALGSHLEPVARAARERIAKHSGYPMDRVSPVSIPEHEQEHEHEQEQEQEQEPEPKKETAAERRLRFFSEVQEIYPQEFNRHLSAEVTGKRAYASDLRTHRQLGFESEEALHRLVLDQVERAKGCEDWRREGGKYVPGIGKWFKNRLWRGRFEPQAGAGLSPQGQSTLRNAFEVLEEMAGGEA